MRIYIFLFITILFSIENFAQQNRINYNNQELFLSGANLAWVYFANDIGPGYTDFEKFADIMLQMHDYGGNALRWWLHTDGTSTPEFNPSGYVIGPGDGTIDDLRGVLNLAWEREIGMKLCLWSFDMLRSNKPPNVLNRNILMLTDTNYTRAYIDNCLIPMVDSLRGHPGIITWEIFNEPEGMSEEFGWPEIEHVPMSVIQRFINLCAGAIHRTDTTAQVTSGAWSFEALTDVQLGAKSSELNQFSSDEKKNIEILFEQKYHLSMTADEILNLIEKLTSQPNYNYYSDSRLIAAGGDPDGTLDFYSVHYYIHLGEAYSPFIHSANYWNLDKAIVVAEFAMQTNNGVPKEELFPRLYQTNYAGALPWSWTDVQISDPEDMLAAMLYMWNNYREDVDVLGIGGDWPQVTIVSPDTNAVFSDSADVEIIADAYDNDGYITLVEFYANNNLIGERDTIPYSIIWTNIPSGNYTLKAIATDNQGHQRTSNRVPIQVGLPPMTNLEAEAAARQGNMIVRSDPNASNGAFVDIPTQIGTITWTLPAVPQAGNYQIIFGYKCFYDTPKEQFLNVNGSRVDTLRFEGDASSWLQLMTSVDLVQGQNTIQMEMFWGWMYLDYMAVPSSIVVSVGNTEYLPFNYSLQQNYPNPFNPVTTVSYSLPKSSRVTLTVYDILGRKVVNLVDEEQSGGIYKIDFDASRLSSGIYFYSIKAGDFIATKKMMLLK